jgi:hypothetical protein
MPGQPVGFDVVSIIPTEPATAQSPALVLQAGDNVTLETYLHFKGAPFEKASLNTYLTTLENGQPEAGVFYHLQDLITGAMVPTISGGTISEMSATDVANAVAAGKLPAGSVISNPSVEGFWVSAATAPITTGLAGANPAPRLAIPGGFSAGTWRVLAHVHPHDPKKHFAAFDDNLVIEVTQ